MRGRGLTAAVVGGLLTMSACSSSPAAAPPPPATTTTTTAATTAPMSPTGSTPDHVVLVLEENHGYHDVIGSADAPYINALAGQGALFTQSYALTHPSEPNYLALFSGSSQGVTDDSCPHRFDVDNLGHQFGTAGRTFTSFAEDLPQVGFTGCSTGDYDSNHNPAASFTDIPASGLQPFSAFPTDFATLPTLAFVAPNVNDDMHNGTVAQGDDWLRQHIDPYLRWARAHNGLLLLTWDEDDSAGDNQIATIAVGPMVKPGRYAEKITHYSVLRTLEQRYGLPALGNAANAAPITDIWSG